MKGKTPVRVAVAGCGAAGMFAAIAAAESGAEVTVFEKNEKAGKKLYISGKGRCNLTNACGTADFFDAVVRGGSFLYSAVYGCDASRVQRFFSERGCPLVTERGMRVFPASGKSSDVIRTLTFEMRRLGVQVRYETAVKEVMIQDARVTGVRLEDGGEVACDALVVATGGLSYPSTGSTGDGYAFAKAAGHTVAPCFPSLVPFETREEWCCALQGLALKNVRLYEAPEEAEKKRRPRFSMQGEMLFTHFGVSGPLVLSASALLNEEIAQAKQEKRALRFAIDLKPALTEKQLDARLVRTFSAQQGKHFINAIAPLFPASLVPVMASLSGIAKEKRAGEVTKRERLAFGALIKQLPFHVTGTRPFTEAVVTRGGVALKEINPSTMESKRARGLYFAGEVLDCDALTGGFNLQIAWSTGYAAGCAAGAERSKDVKADCN